MRVLITGGCGFVMSVLARNLLRSGRARHLTITDLNAPDEHLLRFLGAEHARSVSFERVDVRDAGAVHAVVSAAEPDVVVHGATVTQVPDWEREDPSRYVAVNTLGTSHLLDAARKTPSVPRVVHVSSAAVYGAGNGDPGPFGEDAPLAPDEMYGISKAAAEAIARRCAQLYALEIPIVRFTMVFGPMERPTSGRAVMSLPYQLAAARLQDRPLRVTERTLSSGGDWISAEDVAEALARLCASPEPRAGTFHLAGGLRQTAQDLITAFGRSAEVVAEEDAEVDRDPEQRFGKNAVYAVDRARDRLGWTPRPLAEQIETYLQWADANPQFFRTSTSEQQLQKENQHDH